MKNLVTTLAVLAVTGMIVQAQQQLRLNVGDVKVKGLEVETQKTPQFEASGLKSKNIPNPRDWLEVEVEFEIDGPSDEVVPEILFRYYIGFKDQSGSPRVLTGDVKYTNVLIGDASFSAVYIPPSTLGEITGDFRRFQKSSVEAVGVEIIYNGVIVGGESTLSGSRAKFWEATGTQPGVQPKHKTPFALLWIDRYPEVEQD
jgi:hypothetical protein